MQFYIVKDDGVDNGEIYLCIDRYLYRVVVFFL